MTGAAGTVELIAGAAGVLALITAGDAGDTPPEWLGTNCLHRTRTCLPSALASHSIVVTVCPGIGGPTITGGGPVTPAGTGVPTPGGRAAAEAGGEADEPGSGVVVARDAAVVRADGAMQCRATAHVSTAQVAASTVRACESTRVAANRLRSAPPSGRPDTCSSSCGTSSFRARMSTFTSRLPCGQRSLRRAVDLIGSSSTTWPYFATRVHAASRGSVLAMGGTGRQMPCGYSQRCRAAYSRLAAHDQSRDVARFVNHPEITIPHS